MCARFKAPFYLVVLSVIAQSGHAFLLCHRTDIRLGSRVKMTAMQEIKKEGVSFEGELIERRRLAPLFTLLTLRLFPNRAMAESEQSTNKAQMLTKQLAAVQFTKEIESASEQAFLRAQRGDLAGADKLWSVVIDTYAKNTGNVALSPQAAYRLGKAFGFRADVRSYSRIHRER